MCLAPVVLFVYNRPWHTRRVLQALQQNVNAYESELFVFSDGPKTQAESQNVNAVRELLSQIEGFKSVKIIERKSNHGLATSIISGVSEIISRYGKIIVLEDDLITSPYFLTFMNQALEVFANRVDIFSCTGFNFSSQFMKFPKNYDERIYLNIRPMSWSWATWDDRWEKIDWDVRDFEDFVVNKNAIREFNKGGSDLTGMLKLQMSGVIDSWYIRWAYSAYKSRLLTIYPRVSYVNNIGHDGTGVHCGKETRKIFSHRELDHRKPREFDKHINIVPQIVKSFNKGFDIKLRSKIKRFAKKMVNIS